MIALWMAYTLVTSALFALVAWCLEQVAHLFRWPTRGIWVGATAAMLLGGLTAAGLQMADAPHASTAPANAQPIAAASGGRGAGGPARSIRGNPGSVWRAVSVRMAAQADRFAAWDRLLLSGWALLTAFLAGVVAHAALEGRRLRHGLEAREVGGTSVLLAEGVGPSAVGVLSPTILLPRWALEFKGSLLALVLRHEREHLRARDPLLLLTALLAVVLVPWNLPVWWAWQRLRLAVEVDCDTRVLRAHPDVRRYAELLLLIGQRAIHTPWASRPVITVVAPLQPHASNLASRISVMTQPRPARSSARALLLLGAAAVTATVAFALPAPRPETLSAAAPQRAARAVVHLTSVGVQGARTAGDSLTTPILVYATGAARVGIGGRELVALTDTLRLYRLPAITADVTDGEVHLELTGAGSMSVGGDVSGGPATHVTATGRHIVLLKGGIGIRPAR